MSNKKSKRLGDLQLVENKDKKPTANSSYLHIRVQMDDGSEKDLLFTIKQVKEAVERAEKNPEDIPKVSKFKDFFD